MIIKNYKNQYSGLKNNTDKLYFLKKVLSRINKFQNLFLVCIFLILILISATIVDLWLKILTIAILSVITLTISVAWFLVIDLNIINEIQRLNELFILQRIVDNLRASSNDKERISIIKDISNENIKSILQIIYDHNISFNINSTDVINSEITEATKFPKTLIELLITLSNNKANSGEMIAIVKAFVNLNSQFSELIYNILDRDLKCNINEDIIQSNIK